MNNNNKTTREAFIDWWSNLTTNKKRELTRLYFPDLDKSCGFNRAYLFLSKEQQEKMYLSEHPEQAIKEDGFMDMSFLDVPVGTNEVDDMPEPQKEKSQDNSKEGDLFFNNIDWDALGQEIKRVWGEYGAHYKVYKMILEKAKKEADLTPGSPDSTNPVHSFLVEENRRLKERIEVLEDALKNVDKEIDLHIKYKHSGDGWLETAKETITEALDQK